VRPSSSRWPAPVIIVPVGLAALAFHPILHAYFWADDFMHLFTIADAGLARFFFEAAGAHLYFTRNTVFWACYRLFGLHAEWYFALVLLTHLANVALLFVVARRLTGSLPLACFGAALWGIAPANAGTLGWYSVYGQALAATMLLGVLSQIVRHARDGRVGVRTAALWALLSVIASTCFGTGLAAAVLLPAVLWLLRANLTLARGAWACVLAVPPTIAALYVFQQRHFLSTYAGGPSMQQFMQPYLIFLRPEYLSAIASMLASLVGYGIASLLVGAAAAPLPYPGVLATAAIGAFVTVVVATLPDMDLLARRWIAALGMLVIAVYGLIAAARAAFYTALGASMTLAAAEGRYHYVATMLLALVLCLTLHAVPLPAGARRAAARGVLPVLLALMGLAASANVRLIELRADARATTERVIESIRTEAMAAPRGGVAWIPNQPFLPAGYFPMPDGTPFPGWLAVFEIAFPDDMVDGRRVVFETSQPRLLEAARRGGRIAHLLVPSPVPGGPAPPSAAR